MGNHLNCGFYLNWLMSLNLKLGVRDLTVTNFDPSHLKKWRTSVGRLVNEMNIRHMLSGEYISQRDDSDPYKRLVDEKDELDRLHEMEVERQNALSRERLEENQREMDARSEARGMPSLEPRAQGAKPESEGREKLDNEIQEKLNRLRKEFQQRQGHPDEGEPRQGREEKYYAPQGGGREDPTQRQARVESVNSSPVKQEGPMPYPQHRRRIDWEEQSLSSEGSQSTRAGAAGRAAGLCGKDYAMKLLDRDLGDNVVFIRVYEGRHIREPDTERQKRFVLWKKMADSLKTSKHLLAGVTPLDVQALWVKVCTSAQPNPRELMVTYLLGLLAHTKTTNGGFADWHMRYTDINVDLESVGCGLPDMAKMGWMFYLVGKDMRYESTLNRCKDEDWDYLTCVDKLTQRANEIPDTGVAKNARRQQQTVGAVNNARAEGQGKRPCHYHKRGKCSKGADCQFSHDDGGAGGGQRRPRPAPKPRDGAVDAKSATAEQKTEKGKDGKPVCFTYKATKQCPKEDTCKFSHQLNAFGSVIPNHCAISEAVDGDGVVIEKGDYVGVCVENGLETQYEPYGMQGTVVELFSVVQDAKVVQYCAIDYTEETVGAERRQLAQALSQGTSTKLLSVVKKASGGSPTPKTQHTVARIAPVERMSAAVDTGATIHQTHTNAYFVDYDSSRRRHMAGAGGKTWRTEGEGTVLMHSNCKAGVVIPVVWQYRPGAPMSFFSFGQVQQRFGWTLRTTATDLYLVDKDGQDLFRCPLGESGAVDEFGEPIPPYHYFPEEVFRPEKRTHGVNAVETRLQRAAKHASNEEEEKKEAPAAGAVSVRHDGGRDVLKVVRGVMRQHELHGHAHMDKILHMMNISDKRVREAVVNMCVSCAIAKLASKPVGKPVLPKAEKRLYRVFLDCCGPFVESTGPGHYKHFLHIVDESTSYGEVKLLKKRADAITVIKSWVKYQLVRLAPDKLVEMRLDGAPEFKSNDLREWAEKRGINLAHGLPYIHHHQSKVERAHRTVQEGARALRHRAGLPKRLWPYAIRASREALNRIPSSADVKKGKAKPATVPLVEWEQPDDVTSYMKKTASTIVLGGACIAKREKETLRKGDYPGEYCVYLGRESTSGGHTVLRWNSFKIRENVRTIKEIPGRFPFLDDASGVDPVGVLGERGEALVQEKHEPSAVASKPALPPLEPADEVKKTKKGESKSAKRAAPAYTKGELVMTTAGPAIIDKVLPRNDVRLCWPGGEDPEAFYVVAVKDVWKVEDYPDDVYDSQGHRVAAAAAQPKPVGPNSLLAELPASEIDKMLPRTKKQEATAPLELKERVWQAKHIEWQTLLKKGCYSELMDLPAGHKAHRHVWALKAKPDGTGRLEKVKARCALDGSRDNVPKMDAYSPVAGAATLRCLLASHINNPDVRFWQLDVVSAYLSAPMERELYAYPPDGFRPEETYSKVMRVQKALYGAGDSGRLYYDHWNKIHEILGFQSVHHDKCYLQLYHSEQSFIRFGYHVDDGTYAQVGAKLWGQYLEKLDVYLEYKVGPLSYCLGIQFHIDYDAGIVHMEQAAQVEKMLRTFGLDSDSVKTSPTPVLEGVEPNMEDAVEHSAKEQERGECFKMLAALGALNHLHVSTRPDIGKPLRVASKFGMKFGDDHVRYVKHIMRYMKGTKHSGLTYRRTNPETGKVMQVFTDASHASDVDTRRSVSGIVIKVGGNTVFWKVCFQSIVSHSSTESELMALDKGATLGQYIKWLCLSMGVVAKKPIHIYVDNSATITISSNPVQPGRNLHVHARFFYIRDFVEEGEYEITHLRTDRQLSDVLVTHKSKHTFMALRPLLMGCAYVRAVDGEQVWCEDYL